MQKNDQEIAELREQIVTCLSEEGFNEKEQFILVRRFGLDDALLEQRYDSVIAEELHLTTKRVYQIATKAIRKLRHPARKKIAQLFNQYLLLVPYDLPTKVGLDEIGLFSVSSSYLFKRSEETKGK
jgi:hypothetical protein